MSPDWKEKHHERGEMWRLESLDNYFKVLQQKPKPTSWEIKGVKAKPLFKNISLTHYINPILHITIDKVNDILEHLVDELLAVSETYSMEY